MSQPSLSKNEAPPDVPLIRKGDVHAREDDWDEKPVDVVLLTVNDFEFLAAYEILSEPSTALVKDLGSVYFGNVGETKVALLQSEMGANNYSASAEKGLKARDYLYPNVIIILGVCFGLKDDDKHKHKLGDLLISKVITRYAQVRKNPDGNKVSRNDPFLVDSTIFSLFKHGELGWSSPQRSKYEVNVYTGEILSGPELIDHKETREELKTSYPQALGGEMEAEGLMRLGVPFIVCKSIVDWADGKKNKDWQKFGAKVSASYVAQVLKSRKFTNAYKNRIDTGDEVDAGGGPQKRQQPPCRLEVDELEKVSQRIPHIWRRLAHQTKRFKAYETEAILLSRPGEGETSKALTMLMRYDERGGTRKELADALKEVDQVNLSKEVLSGEYD